MKKFLRLPVQLEELALPDHKYLDLHVGRDALVEWCLCLELLRQHFVDTIVLDTVSGTCALEIANRTSFERNESGKYKIMLTQGNCDYMSTFCLRYYRDGVAEVDHIDIQTELGGYITLSVDESIPPVSLEEAKRRLGL